jgi:hypothetical protein
MFRDTFWSSVWLFERIPAIIAVELKRCGAIEMGGYETSTTVGGQGEIHLAGLPFQPGTEVAVVIRPRVADEPASVGNHVDALIAALNCGHNLEPIGRLNRDELYDRDNLH